MIYSDPRYLVDDLNEIATEIQFADGVLYGFRESASAELVLVSEAVAARLLSHYRFLVKHLDRADSVAAFAFWTQNPARRRISTAEKVPVHLVNMSISAKQFDALKKRLRLEVADPREAAEANFIAG